MALSGIPIDPQQCIGDSLIVLNDSFSELDSRTLSLSSDIASSNSNLTSTIQSVSSALNSSISLTSSNLYSLIQTTNSSLTGLTQVVGASSGNLTSTIQAVSSNLYTIIQSTSSTQTVPVKFSYTGNDLLSSFALTGTNLSVSPISYRVTIDGVVQDPSVDFNISGSDLIFTNAPLSGTKIVIITAENYTNTTVTFNGNVGSQDLQTTGNLSATNVFGNISNTTGINNDIDVKFFPLSGGTITGATRINADLTVYGNLSATGASYFSNTFYSTTSALSVVNIGNTGPALYVGNNGTGDIASFYDLDQGVEVLHVGGSNGSFPNVGIKTNSPNESLTVVGNVSASGSILSYNDGSSSLWKLEDLMLACSDESTNLTTSTSAVTFRVPFGMYLNSVRASVNVAPVGSTIIVDVKQNGTSIFSTLLSIDANEETSTTAAVPAVISNRNLTDDAKIVVSINQVGSSTAGRGLKLTFKGYRI